MGASTTIRHSKTSQQLSWLQSSCSPPGLSEPTSRQPPATAGIKNQSPTVGPDLLVATFGVQDLQQPVSAPLFSLVLFPSMKLTAGMQNVATQLPWVCVPCLHTVRRAPKSTEWLCRQCSCITRLLSTSPADEGLQCENWQAPTVS